MENPDYLVKDGFLDDGIERWRVECRDRFRNWFNLIDELNAIAISVLMQLTITNTVMWQVLVAALYIRSLHNFEAAVALAERGMVTQSRVLARALLDALFPLVLTTKAHQFADDFTKQHDLNRLKLYKKACQLKHSRPSGVDSEESAKLAEELKNIIAEEEITELRTREIASRAGMEEWYLTAYALLSETVHSRVGDLEEYLVLDSDEKIKEFDWGPRTNGIESLFLISVEAMIVAIEHVSALAKEAPEKRIKAARQRFYSLVKERFEV